MIYIFRLEILTGLAGIGLAFVAEHLADRVLIAPAFLRRWVAISIASLAVLVVMVVTALTVRNLFTFHNWSGNDLTSL
jgi:hypothetical protein